MSSPLDRYQLINELLSPDAASAYWRAYDTALDREVVIRLVDAADPRAELLNSSARAAAVVQDRRLGQILDVLAVPSDGLDPARVAVINEWIQGESLLSFMAAREWNPLELQQAISIVGEVAQALVLAHDLRVRHGRLLPSNVLLTDSGEVRVIGMAIDAVMLGTSNEDYIRSDINALGGLLYLMLTGRTPFEPDILGYEAHQAPSAPRPRAHLEPPSHLRADIPHELDVLIGRSMIELRRPRGTTKFRTVSEFLQALTQIRAGLEPVVAGPHSSRLSAMAVRVTIVVAVLAGIALLVVAWRQLYIGPDSGPTRSGASTSQTAVPSASTSTAAPGPAISAVAATSFDPFGDDDRDGVGDGSAGREHEQQADRAIDGRQATSWKSLRYAMPNANGKGGVGLVIDLGSTQSVESVDIAFDQVGAAVRVGVANAQLPAPTAWPLLAKAPAGADHVMLDSPQALAGRYVLLWFPRLPSSLQHPGMHQVRVSEVVVHGRG